MIIFILFERGQVSAQKLDGVNKSIENLHVKKRYNHGKCNCNASYFFETTKLFYFFHRCSEITDECLCSTSFKTSE